MENSMNRKKKEEGIVYTPGSLSTLNGIEKRFERLEHLTDEHSQTLCIHTKTIGLMQEAVYRDGKKNLENYICQNCPYRKYLEETENFCK